MKKLVVTLLISSLSCLMTGCFLFGGDDDFVPKLPPETTTGEYTFGFKLNGEVFNLDRRFVADYQGGQLAIYADYGLDTEKNYSMALLLSNPLLEENQRYDLTEDIYHALMDTWLHDDPETVCTYELEDTYEGFVEFTNIDRVKYIVSGRFEFSTANDQCDTMRLTEGRFDMWYVP